MSQDLIDQVYDKAEDLICRYYARLNRKRFCLEFKTPTKIMLQRKKTGNHENILKARRDNNMTQKIKYVLESKDGLFVNHKIVKKGRRISISISKIEDCCAQNTATKCN